MKAKKSMAGFKIEITDLHFYDYFFNRCLSLIALAIQYLQ